MLAVSLLHRQMQIATSRSELSSLQNIFDIQEDTGTAVVQWLRYCATNRKVAGSIPAGVIGVFH